MPPKPFNKPFRILSIDGGGLRGIVAVKIIQWIEQNITKKPILDSFDLLAGTSTGGLIACALALKHDSIIGKPKFDSNQISKIYEEEGSTIFPYTSSLAGKKYARTRNLWRPKFSANGLEKVLQACFAERRLSDCLKPVFVSSYDIRTHMPLFFTNRFCSPISPSYKKHPDGNAKLRDICRATSAAPTFLPAHKFNYISDSGYHDSPHCIDGGVFINNPALAAMVEILTNASDPIYTNNPNRDVEISDRNIHILSLGTGLTNKSIDIRHGKSWGIIKWVPSVIQIMMQGNSQAIDYQLNTMIKDNRYVRMDINIDSKHADMDDSSSETRTYLKDQVDDQIANNYYWTHRLTSFKNIAQL